MEHAAQLRKVFKKQFSIRSQKKDFRKQRKIFPDVHKYDRGHVLIFAGSPGKFGAASLCVQGAHIGGAGWVTFAVSQVMVDSYFYLQQAPLSTVYEPLLDQNSNIDAKKLDAFLEQRDVRVIVFGPGWMKNKLTTDVFLVLEKFSQAGGFLIFDAGATQNLVNALAGMSINPDRTIALPHPGEWRKLGSPSFEMFATESTTAITKLKKSLENFPTTLIWKSSRPIVFGRSTVFLQNLPCPDLARAGTGDFLAGLIAGSCLLFEEIADAFSYAHAKLVESATELRKKNESAVTLEKVTANVKGFY